ncbi:MepB family protein [Clostridium gasigenes]|uniref:MepB family protein n=1 Tax=Clostridium gasigenes TaxID=94869 RepID=UPI001C0D2F2C|nr:MepB family protein [Clostridium gasigenes]MBU3105808.1 MepB family protein [Clostridium gasigenes]
MNKFNNAVNYANRILYKPNNLFINNLKEENQNSDYGAGVFQLNSKSIRFRVAKITPNKIGQFVAFWEKDDKNKNQPFSYNQSPDLLVINTFKDNHFGQFIFPKEVLIKKGILKTNEQDGKMAIRVYPSWDTPTNKQAIATQKWQLIYFIDISDTNKLLNQEILKLYL